MRTLWHSSYYEQCPRKMAVFSPHKVSWMAFHETYGLVQLEAEIELYPTEQRRCFLGVSCSKSTKPICQLLCLDTEGKYYTVRWKLPCPRHVRRFVVLRATWWSGINWERSKEPFSFLIWDYARHTMLSITVCKHWHNSIFCKSSQNVEQKC